MKKVISILCALALFAGFAFAQNPQRGQGNRHGRGGEGWRERVRAEKVAFLTEQIDLTESEAQVFWPIYNQIQKEQREAFEAVRKAYEAMENGVKEGKTGKDMEKLVKAYVEAKDKSDGFETKAFNQLIKALPAEKVARYYVAEEKFRQQQIGRLGNGNFPNFKMSEEQKQQWKERGEQFKEQLRSRGNRQQQKNEGGAAPQKESI
jgi:Spy/CpxP family protein refolding chaperone